MLSPVSTSTHHGLETRTRIHAPKEDATARSELGRTSITPAESTHCSRKHDVTRQRRRAAYRRPKGFRDLDVVKAVRACDDGAVELRRQESLRRRGGQAIHRARCGARVWHPKASGEHRSATTCREHPRRSFELELAGPTSRPNFPCARRAVEVSPASGSPLLVVEPVPVLSWGASCSRPSAGSNKVPNQRLELRGRPEFQAIFARTLKRVTSADLCLRVRAPGD